jgi:hypothetical protein
MKCTDCDTTTSKDDGGRVCVCCEKVYCESCAETKFTTHVFLCDTCVADKNEALSDDARKTAQEEGLVLVGACSISRPHNSRRTRSVTRA